VTLCEAGSGPTLRLLEERLDFSRTAREGNRHRFELGEGGPAAIVQVLDDAAIPKGQEATGTVHHVAYRTRNDGQQLAWRKRLIAAGLEVTPVIDRTYFHSIYFREPGGVLFEIATDPPGFTVDETSDELGSGLMLPEHLEGRRDSLSLTPLALPRRA
jgi:glyoxalase family protein